MKILHTEASCGWGGQEIRILEECRGMAARGHEVRLLCPAEARILVEAPRFGVHAEALPIGRKNLSGLFALRRALARLRPAVINTHSSTDTWLAALACLTLHDAPPLVRTRHISAPVPDNASSRWLYRRASRHVVTTGEQLRTDLIQRLDLDPERVTSVPTGIDPARFRPGDRGQARRDLGLVEDTIWIGVVATLRSWKGHLYLLEALAGLAQTPSQTPAQPEVRLAIVGDGPYREVIAAKVAELGLNERVVMAGHQRNAEQWMQAFDLFCLPSYANEGVPQALMQAMMTGLPVVSTPVGAIAEIIEDGVSGLLTPPRDAPALTNALERLLADPEAARRLGEAALARGRERFGFDRMIERMESIFLTAAGKRAP